MCAEAPHVACYMMQAACRMLLINHGLAAVRATALPAAALNGQLLIDAKCTQQPFVCLVTWRVS